MMRILLHALSALLYSSLAVYFWRTRWLTPRVESGAVSKRSRRETDGRGFSWQERLVLTCAVLLHGTLLADAIFGGGQFRFGFAHALSLMAWLALIFYGAESFFYPLEGMPALVLAPAAFSVMLPSCLGGGQMTVKAQAPAFAAHLFIAMLAYAFMAIAAAHAALMLAVEKRLHAPNEGRGWALPLGLPPLLTMERLLFQMLATGFVFLTLTVASGVVFSEEVFGRALTFDHKTVFGLLSWMIVAILLLGRWIKGWRGRTALNGTFAGFAALVLAYVGSRFVIEVLLGRMT